MKGDNDDQLKWPISSSLTLEITVKSTSTPPMGHLLDEPQPQRKSRYRHYGGWKSSEYIYESDDDCDVWESDVHRNSGPLELSLRLSHYSKVTLGHVDKEITQELKWGSVHSEGPWTAEVTLLEPKQEPEPKHWHPYDDDLREYDYSNDYDRDYYD